MKRYYLNEIFSYIGNALSNSEKEYIRNNIPIITNDAESQNLKKDSDIRLMPDDIIQAAEKYSVNLLKKVSMSLRGYVDNNCEVLAKHYYYQNEINLFYRHRDEGCLENAIYSCLRQIAISEFALEEFRTRKDEIQEQISNTEKRNKDLLQLIDGNDNGSVLMKELYEQNKARINELRNFIPPNLQDFSGPLHYGYKQLCIILEKQGKYEEALNYSRKALAEHWGGNWHKRIEKLKKKIKKD